jgi:hypothetical protein
VANRVKANVEAIGELLLELNDGFILKLLDVLYVRKSPTEADNLANLSPYNLVVSEITTDFKPTNI